VLSLGLKARANGPA